MVRYFKDMNLKETSLLIICLVVLQNLWANEFPIQTILHYKKKRKEKSNEICINIISHITINFMKSPWKNQILCTLLKFYCKLISPLISHCLPYILCLLSLLWAIHFLSLNMSDWRDLITSTSNYNYVISINHH